MTTKDMSAEEIKEGLKQFYGSLNHHRLTFLGKPLATDGVAWLCENAKCYWLIDAIASYQPKCMRDDMLRFMQFWTLKVKGNKAVLTCERDKDDVVITQEIEYTNFPLEEIKIWVENGVAMLPSER